MWLRDSLPHDLTYNDRPMARVLIYGYESSLPRSKSFQNLEDLATSFHATLLALAGTSTVRPIIFIAHSLGGLIVKQVGLWVCHSVQPPWCSRHIDVCCAITVQERH
jgi:hypothetical protein